MQATATTTQVTSQEAEIQRYEREQAKWNRRKARTAAWKKGAVQAK